MLFRKITKAVHECEEQSKAAAKKTEEELEEFYLAELLDLLQKTAERKFKNNQILQTIITAKIASLRETTSGLQIVEFGSTKGGKEVDTVNRRIAQYFNELKAKKWVQKFTGVSHSRFSPFRESGASTSAIPTSSSPSSSQAMLLGGPSRSRTPTPSLFDHRTSGASCSQQTLLPVSGREQATTINEMAANRVVEDLLGGSSTLGALLEADESQLSVEEGVELNLKDFSASSENVGLYITKHLVNPFLQKIRSDMTRLSDAHHLERVYNSTINEITEEYEKAIKKADDQRQRTPEDQQARSALAHLQLWVNITAAVSAIEALSKVREESAQRKLTDIRSPVYSPSCL